jgi:hypothetical protein
VPPLHVCSPESSSLFKWTTNNFCSPRRTHRVRRPAASCWVR